MRLQSTKREVACGPSRRQTDDSKLRHRNAWFLGAGGFDDGGLRAAGDRACVLQPVAVGGPGAIEPRTIAHDTAIFRQVDKDQPSRHHDALEFPDGETVLLTHLAEGQHATVLQLPAKPQTAKEAQAQQRVAYVG